MKSSSTKKKSAQKKDNDSQRSSKELRTIREELAAKNRELKIQSSLEKVRAVALGMKKPEDMIAICKTISKQLAALGVKEIRNIQTAIFYEQRGTYMNYQYYARHNKTFITETCYTDHKTTKAFAAKMRKGKGEFFITHLKGKKVKDWLAYQKTTNVFIDKYLNTASSLSYYWYSLGPVALGISTYHPLIEEGSNLFKRFLNVFELAYRRYLDIETAEAQAREAKIEAALEKVRSRSLAMHKSDELQEVVHTVFEKLKELNVDLYTAIIFIFVEGSKDFVWWLANKANQQYSRILVPYSDNPYLENLLDAKENGTEFFSETYSFEEKNELFHHLFEHTDFKYVPENQKKFLLESQLATMSVALAKNTGINITSYSKKSFSENENEILRRFAKVFDQAYTRFLDLQKAEAQAKESQIQLALERVRARTMAMQKSEELQDATLVLFQQFKQLRETTNQVSICIFDDEIKYGEMYLTLNGEKIDRSYIMELDKEVFVMKKAKKTFLDKQKTFTRVITGKELQDYNQWRNSLVGRERWEESDAILNQSWYVYGSFFSKGMIGVSSNSSASEDTLELLERFANVFDGTYTRFNDLKKAEAQAREAKIEVALERVRSRAMAMHKSEDLQMAIATVFEELDKMNLGLIRCGIAILDKEKPRGDIWITIKSDKGNVVQVSGDEPMDIHPLLQSAYDSWRKQEDLSYILSDDDLLTYYEAITKTNFQQPISATFQSGQKTQKQYYFNAVFQDGSLFAFLDTAFTDEAKVVMKRFANVFNLTYKRFLDLQKAEAQAREAKIEAALERVRSKAMAMHKSEDLNAAVAVVFEELEKLDLSVLRCGISVLNKEKRTGDVWLTSQTDEGSTVQVSGDESFDIHPLLHGAFEAWLRQEDFYYVLEGDDLTNYYKAVKTARFELPESQFVSSETEYKKQYCNVSVYHAGGLFAFRETEFPEEAKKVMKRFSNVFDLTYKRFLDLQRAEAQAREAQIEASLERVRAHAMAMHDSRDLSQTVNIFFKELKTLGITPMRCGVGEMDGEKKTSDLVFTTADKQGELYEIPGKLKYEGHPIIENIYTYWKRQEEYHPVLQGADINAYYRVIKSQMALPDFPDYTIHYGNYFYFKEGFFFAWAEKEFTEEAMNIFRRFTSVLSLTYKRYKDLKQAEANAREAQIEVALERVRSRTLAMQKSDELAETAAVLFQQLIRLGIEQNRLYINIIKDEAGEAEFWITDEDGTRVSTAYTADMNANPSFKKMYEGWKQQKKSLIIDMQREELQRYFRHLSSLNVPFKGGLSQKRRIQYIAYFSKGFIGMASPDEQPTETLQLLERFAYVFNLTFTRFNDLQMAEAHAIQAEKDFIAIKEAKQKAEEALNELQATQTQLIQSEKMASLGELTAGIAHEIQNPLNFVNNFSEVSNELLDEMKQELATGNREQATEIANDVKQNLEKILHHGKRADAIVKGMLQHSRTSSGQKELTDINALADEYLRLAYHGLRAKDKTFNAKFEANCDNSIEKINIIPQDIGRVILNLINNAFYAVSEKKKQLQDGYEPTVTVSTKKVGDKVELRVTDNGNGIPQKVLDKIFQPFFTTKPTGEGTGLGLSLSYDIITKGHGGELKVETKEGEGSEFVIQLPLFKI
jgi:signal transduction histidine kinase